MMYVANVVGLFAGLIQPTVVSFMTQLILSNEIGRVFSLFGIGADLALVVATLSLCFLVAVLHLFHHVHSPGVCPSRHALGLLAESERRNRQRYPAGRQAEKCPEGNLNDWRVPQLGRPRKQFEPEKIPFKAQILRETSDFNHSIRGGPGKSTESGDIVGPYGGSAPAAEEFRPADKMSDDALLKMYEAQAIAMEKQDEIDRLKREKEELEERLRRVDLGKEGRSAESSSSKFNEVWTAINGLKQQYTDVNNIQEEIRVDLNSLKETNRIDMANVQQQMEETCAAINDLRKQCSDMNNLLEKTRTDINGLHQNAAQNSPKITQRQNTIEIEKAEQKPSWIKRIVEKISEQRNTILIIGERKKETECAGIAVLSGDRSKWIELKLKLPHNAVGSGVVYLNGEIYLFGGIRNPKDLYKLDKNMEWIRLADMNEGRRGINNGCLEWNGYIWVFGGVSEKRECLKTVERYDPKEDKWTLMPEMKTVRSSAATTLWNDKIIISGGWIAETTLTITSECFNLEDCCWADFPNMPTYNGGHSLVSYRNKLILIGGTGKGAYNTVWELDPLKLNARWKLLPPMKYASNHFPGIVLDNEIYAIGGYQGRKLPHLSRVEIFDRKHWRDGPSLPYTWRCMSAVIIPQHLADRLCAD